jgi:hypothetical protein
VTIGTGLFLIAVGAILRYAITTDVVADVNLDVAGLILMIVGAVGLTLGLFLFFHGRSPGPPGTTPTTGS